MAAPFRIEVADTFASSIVFTRLLACLQGRDFAWRALHINLTTPPSTVCVPVAFTFGTDLDPGTWLSFRPKRHKHLLVALCLFTKRAPVAAPSGLEVTDAFASLHDFTRRLAYLEVGNFTLRGLHINLTSTPVA